MAIDGARLRRHPQWGIQTSLWQWGQPAFYLFVLTTLAGLLFIIAQSAALFTFSPTGFILSWVLLLLYAVPVFIFVFTLDLYEREPLSLVFAAILWGAVGATTLSVFGNQGWGLAFEGLFGAEFMASWAAAVTAPWVEEVAKVLGVVFIYLIARREIDDLTDGFVYGAMVGLGFKLYEDVFYFVAKFGGEVGDVLAGFFIRVVAGGLYSHVLYSALAGMGVAYFVTRRGEVGNGRRYGVAIALFLTAVLAHFIWNSPLLNFFPQTLDDLGDWLQIIWAFAIKGVPFLIFAVMMVRLAHAREHRWLATVLTAEAGRPGLTQEELDELDTPKERRQARRRAKAQGGPAAARAMKKLQREQINLAMVATRTHDPGHPDVHRQHEYCARLREWVDSLTAGARPPGGGPPSQAPGGSPAAPSTPPPPPPGEGGPGTDPPPPPPPES